MTEMIKKCPECNGINLFWNKEKGEVICKDCGLVIEDKMVDFGQEWREIDAESAEKRRRTGAPMTYTQFDQGLGTEVGQKADFFKLKAKDGVVGSHFAKVNEAEEIYRNISSALMSNIGG